MTPKPGSIAISFGVLAIMAASIFMSGCGGGSTSAAVTTTTPAVSLSTLSLTLTSQAVGTPSAAQTVTVVSSGTAALSVSGIAASGDFSQTNNCSTAVAPGASCVINVIFTPTASGTRTGTLIITDNASNSPQTVSLSGSETVNNSVAVNVNFGPDGNLGPPTATSSSYYNGIFTTVTVCVPGSTNCATIPNVLVDTGSEGLRILSNQIPGVTLPSITDSSSNVLYECVQYGDMSYNWGPMQMATVQIGGETASQLPGATVGTGIPIQVIAAGGSAPLQVLNGNQVIATPCATGGGPSDNSVAILGANGILGIGNFAQDCGPGCTSAPAQSPNYILCTSNGSSCALTAVPLSVQAWNPVSAFNSADTNGVVLQLPSIPAAGELTVAGTLVFGIGTETCPGSPPGCFSNALGTSQLYALDQSGNFSSIVFNGVTYTSANNPAYLDSGSQALYISDAATLGISDCTIGNTDIFFYCPSSTLNIGNIGLTGSSSVGSGTVSLSIANALTLFATNPNFAAFNNLGGDSGTGAANDYFDFGLPFFFGRNVYVGIEGTTPPNGASAPNGYFAF